MSAALMRLFFFSPLGSVEVSVIDLARFTDGGGGWGALDFRLTELSFPRMPFRPGLATVGSSIFSAMNLGGSSSIVEVDPPDQCWLVLPGNSKDVCDDGDDGREFSVSLIGEIGGEGEDELERPMAVPDDDCVVDGVVVEGLFGGDGGGTGMDRRVESRKDSFREKLLWPAGKY